MIRQFIISFLIGLLLFNILLAETHIGGWISGRLTREGSPYICDLDGAWGFGIARGDTLIIEAGVTLLFPEDGGIECWGVLIAEGTENDSITFDKAGEELWYYIIFMDSTFDDIEIQEVLFRYCRFRNWRPYNEFGFLKVN